MIKITEDNFSIDQVVNEIKKKNIGAIVSFLGIVRGKTEDRNVEQLEIQTYKEMAHDQLKKIEKETFEKFNVKEITIIHRIGVLKVTENILLIVIGSSHRDDAFKACRFVLEELKKNVPLWKKEYTKTGEVWILGGKK